MINSHIVDMQADTKGVAFLEPPLSYLLDL